MNYGRKPNFLISALALTFFISSARGHTYVVRPGDNLSHSILGIHVPGPVWGVDGSFSKALKLNPNLKNPNLIFPGMEIDLTGLVSESTAETESTTVPVVETAPTVSTERAPASVEPSTVVSETEASLPPADPHIESVGFTPSLSYTQIYYQETRVADYKANALTLKLNYRRALSAKWDAGVNSYFTAHTLNSNNSTTQMRMLGVNLRAGYQIPLVAQIRLNLMGGLYYATTIVSRNAFGYNNVSGPQIFPVLSSPINQDKDSVYVYGKYSPMFDGMSFSSTGNERAAGLGYVYGAHRALPITLSVDYAEMNLNFKSVLYMKNRSLSFGLGLSW